MLISVIIFLLVNVTILFLVFSNVLSSNSIYNKYNNIKKYISKIDNKNITL